MDTPIVPQKQCSKCKQLFPATTEYFHRNRTRKDGLQSQCRACVGVYITQYNAAHREEQRLYSLNRRREQPEKVRNEDRCRYQRDKEKIRVRGQKYRAENAQAISERNKRYRAANPDKQRKWQQKYIAANPELRREIVTRYRSRKRGNGGNHTKEDVRLLLHSQNSKCWWCGAVLDETYEVDHRIPLSRGGTNAPENLCISCRSCNRSKGNKLPSEWGDRLL